MLSPSKKRSIFLIRTLVNVSEANPELLTELQSLASTRDRAERLRVLATIGLMVVKGNADLLPRQAVELKKTPDSDGQSDDGAIMAAKKLLNGF
jgi:hypothetical protein